MFNKQVNNKLVDKEKVSNKKDNYQTTASNSYNNNHYSDLECHTKMTSHSINTVPHVYPEHRHQSFKINLMCKN